MALALLAGLPAAGPAGSWIPQGLTGGGAMFAPAISPLDSKTMMINCDMGGVYLSRDGGENWTLIPHNQLQGNIHCPPLFHPRDPHIIFAAHGWAGRLRKSEDGGRSWKDWGDLPEGLEQLAVDPDAPAFMLAAVEDKAYASLDGGAHWRPGEGIQGEVMGFVFQGERDMHVLGFGSSPLGSRRRAWALSETGVFGTEDNGETWNLLSRGLPRPQGPAQGAGLMGRPGLSGAGWSLFALFPSKDPKVLDADNIFGSRDGGETWERLAGRGLNRDVRAADDWAEGPSAHFGFLLSSSNEWRPWPGPRSRGADGGSAKDRLLEWAHDSPLRPSPVATPWQSIRPPPVLFLASTSTGYMPPHFASIYKSQDGGENWKAVIYSDPRYDKFNVDQDYRTARLGQNYNGAPLGLAVSPSNPDALIFVDDMKAYVTQDGGKRWKAAHARPAAPLHISRNSEGRMTDPQASWRCNGLVVTSAWDYAVDPHEPNRRYIPYTDILFARSLDGGASWRWGIEGLPWHNTCYQLAFDPEVPGRMWGAFSDVHDIPNGNIILGRHSLQGGGGVGFSQDFGETWRVAGTGLPQAPVRSLILDPSSPRGARTLYASSFGHGVYRSADGGRQWTQTGAKGLGAPGLNMRVCRLNLHQDGALDVLITGLRRGGHFERQGPGLYRSRNQGETWICLNRSRPLRWPKDYAVDPRDSRVIYIGASDILPWMDFGTESVENRSEGGLWRSLDEGATWTRVLRKGPEHYGVSIEPKTGWLYATLCEGAEGPPLWLSKDRGETWKPFEDFPFGNATKVAFDPIRPGRIYVSTFGASVWEGPREPL